MIATQEVVPGVGTVDLVLRAAEHAAVVLEVWVEAKVWAPESGDQLSRYQGHLATRGDGVPRTLVVLGPRPISTAAGIPWVSWQDIRDEVSRSPRRQPALARVQRIP